MASLNTPLNAEKPTMNPTLTEARERIQAAYDPELIRAAGGRLAELLTEHMARVQACEGSVLNWEEPPTNIDTATAYLTEGPALPDVETLNERFGALVEAMLARGNNLHDPRYMGHQVPASVPIAGLFDAVGSVTNQVMAIYEMGPWASSVEQAMINVLGREVGYPDGTFGGLVTHGGSLANLTGLLTARNVTMPDAWENGLASCDSAPLMVVHGDSHYSVARAAGVLGLGTRQVVRAALDPRRRIDPDRLDTQLAELHAAGRSIAAVAACACATPIGAFDPLDDIADVCQRHGVWMHVDAAHGAAACLSARHRHLVSGLARADSVVWDAHKMLFVPALCAFVFYKDRQHRFEAFRQEAPYLFDVASPGLAEFDSALKTFECTKRAAVFGLWGVWSLFGRSLFADMVDVTFALGRQFYEKLAAAPDFEPLHEPECNIVAFRHLPDALRSAPPEEIGAFQLAVRRRVVRSGEAYIVPATDDDQPALRVVLINPLTTEDHLDRLLDSLRNHGREILGR